ncbi:MAG: hypothetical protein JO352_01240 [Chloroflexi bacterium]|nr:hypothetical protein [Chloroflexota bacterium]
MAQASLQSEAETEFVARRGADITSHKPSEPDSVSAALAAFSPIMSRDWITRRRSRVKPLSTLLEELSEESKQAEQSVSEAHSETRQQLEARKLELKQQIDTKRSEQQAAVTQAHTTADTKWQQLQASMRETVQNTEAELDAAKVDWNAQKAEARAEVAEAQAQDAVEFARQAIAEAQYAAVYALQCRAEADELVATTR